MRESQKPMMKKTTTSVILHQDGEIVQEKRVTLRQLADETGCEVTWIEELVHYGIVEPVAKTPETLVFPEEAAGRIGKAMRLKQDFHLAPEGLGLVLDLLDRIEELEERISREEEK